MSYQMKASDVFGFASSCGAQTKQKGDELFFRLCPYCCGGDHHDKETFSVNLKTGAFKCFRSSCGKQGHFVELARDFCFPLDVDEPKRAFRRLPQKEVVSSAEAIAFMSSRGISEAVTKKYRITTQTENKNILVFPFYDEKNLLVSVKYRKIDFDRTKDKCKEWFVKDTKPILFGMDHCSSFDRLIITEGQIDSLSVSECGIENAVSVPNGANGFTWLNYCYDWLDQFQEIIVFGDCENGKVTLADPLSKRIKKLIKVVRPIDYLGEKDANDLLRRYGKQAVVSCIENAEVMKVSNIVPLADVKSVDYSTMPKIRTNIESLDRAIAGGFFFGDLIALTGKCGEGKSTFMSQLACEVLEQGERILIYSGELSPVNVKHWLHLQLAGEENLIKRVSSRGDSYFLIDPEAEKLIELWYNGRAFVYQNNYISTDEDCEDLLQTIEQTIQRCAVRVVFVDNLMTAMEGVNDQNGLYQAQSKFVGSLKRLAMQYDVVIVLVAHPRKGNTKDFTNDSVSGSADITNKADIVLCYQKAEPDSFFDSVLMVTKNRHNGTVLKGEDAIGLIFGKTTKRLSTKADRPRQYGWERYKTMRTDDFDEIL